MSNGASTRMGTGRIPRRILTAVRSPQRDSVRDLDVFLPLSYATTRRRYPVVYMQDGQNLADPERAFAGTWDLEQAIETLAARGIEAIVVGIPNLGDVRIREYTPFVDAKAGGGDGDAYLAYLERTIKPLIDRRFRTRPDRDATGVFGSSLGGLISLYAFFRAPETFGFTGAMSPSLWFAGRAMLSYIERDGAPDGRIYLDTGTEEGVGTLRDARDLMHILAHKGYGHERLRFVEDPGGRHAEADWARRLVPALEFLLRPVCERRVTNRSRAGTKRAGGRRT
ncbi:MAG TPA: alpha/beta hydrolase-fold protein [Vicinamibacterales bacterium]|nr:alpha/beta hydrolase-fold protein [Vicinamibacterales bacterium]